MNYEDKEDPIDCPERLKWGFGEDYTEDISNVFEKILNEASDNDISATGLEEINESL